MAPYESTEKPTPPHPLPIKKPSPLSRLKEDTTPLLKALRFRAMNPARRNPSTAKR